MSKGYVLTKNIAILYPVGPKFILLHIVICLMHISLLLFPIVKLSAGTVSKAGNVERMAFPLPHPCDSIKAQIESKVKACHLPIHISARLVFDQLLSWVVGKKFHLVALVAKNFRVIHQ